MIYPVSSSNPKKIIPGKKSLTIKKNLKNPITAFIQWFNSLANTHKEYIAHIYFVLTTQDTTDLALDEENAFIRFQMFVTRQDFPLRVVARMVVIRSVMDFVFINRDQLAPDAVHGPDLIDIAEKQWETASNSWKNLRAKELSDPYIRLWLQAELASI